MSVYGGECFIECLFFFEFLLMLENCFSCVFVFVFVFISHNTAFFFLQFLDDDGYKRSTESDQRWNVNEYQFEM
jgi:hypothetical protein